MSRLYLALVFVLALAARLFFLAELAEDPIFEVLVGDASRYDAWARQAASGDWLGREMFYQAPLYPYFLGAIYALAGPDIFLARVVQAMLGAFGCALVTVAADRLLG